MKPGKSKPNGIEILIAEDSRTQAEKLQRVLEEHGYTAVTALDGKQALAAARRRKPTLVISDVLMPELDGYGLCKAIKSDDKLKDVLVVLVTSLSDSQDVIRGLECGADNFVRKPYDEHYLLSRIEQLLMNRELRKTQKMQLGVEIELGGHKHFITSERQQILDLLISTYEQAVGLNAELRLREKELAHSNQVLQGLYRIAEGLNRAASEKEVTESVLERATELPRIQAGWISLREGESGFRLAAARNLPPALEATGAMEGDCTCRRRLVSGELDSVTNILECERLEKAQGDTRGLRYHASVPLRIGDRTLGVMNLVGPQKGLFNDEELRLLYSVGEQVAVALERATLHERLEQLVAERTAKLEAEIVERKRIEKEQARLVAIIEATPDMVATGDQNGHVLYYNRAGLRMLGFEPGLDVSTVSFLETHPHWAAKLVAETGIPHAIEHGTWSGETALLGRDGREIPISQVIIAHKGSDGSVEYLSTIARDITKIKEQEARLQSEVAERRQAEEEVRALNEELESKVVERTAELRSANRELESFSYSVSHDLRAPLRHIDGYIQMLAEDTAGTLSSEARRYLEVITDSGRKMGGLIDDLLEFSRMGRAEMRETSVELDDLVREAIRDLEMATAGRNIAWQIPSLPRVVGDPAMLKQVFANLLSNAVKFTGTRDVAEIEVGVQSAPNEIVFFVRDNGVGFDMKYADRLFGVFQRLHRPDEFEGTGIGLANVQRIIARHGGRVWAEAAPDQGATFYFALKSSTGEQGQ
jgi:PAS domain S-box-containing protein